MRLLSKFQSINFISFYLFFRSSEDEINESELLVKNDSISNEPSDSLLLTTQPDFSGIDF